MRCIESQDLEKFELYLHENEKSLYTIRKYVHDLKVFMDFIENKEVDREVVLNYKAYLMNLYRATSVNSMLAALNSFFDYMNWRDLRVRQLKVQRKVFNPESKELSKNEYKELVKVAQNMGNERLSLLVETLCATGIRISELRYITIEGIEKGEIVVNCKGKIRVIFIVDKLKKKLLKYAKKKKISTGCVFITRNGNPLNRSNIWRDLKKLSNKTDINPEKVYPHNLRHLFARVFYDLDKDIAKLADILGHSSIDTTRIYVITSQKEHKEKIEKMHLTL